jgi:hypothetical protein
MAKIHIPNRVSLVEEFGYAENRGKTNIPMVMSSTAYDILNHMLVDVCLTLYLVLICRSFNCASST